MDSSLLLTIVAATTIGFFTLFTKFRSHKKKNDVDSSPPSSLSSSSLVVVSPISHNCTHQVFPSFHGADVRRGFLSHILKEFTRKGIEPFNDNKIVKSKSIGPELIEAIRGSKISIILLSRNYASSTWCLNELAEIMNCREELRQIVMPVFYEVDPTDVKKQTGDFGNVFKKTCKGKTKEDIGRWRHALAEVAKIAGHHSRNWDNEATMIEIITNDISNKLNNSTPSNDFHSLIGMGAHMEEMEPMLCLGSNEVKMIGIWGPSGIGKTTIAGYVFERHSNNYELSVFMDDIKTFMYTRLATICSNDRNTKLKLQEHLMSRIFNQKDIVAPHLGVVKDRLKDKKVLIVLDDVHRSVILDAMAEDIRWFGPGSRIIITTQDKRLLRAHGIKDIYNVPFPESDEALQIFCMNAFGQNFPKEGFEELAWQVTRLAGRLPLGLKVLGSHFRQMPKDDWTNELQSLRNHLDGEIMSILRFSYDALDDEEKDLFLHLACLFNGRPIEPVEALLVKRFPDLKRQVRILRDKSLIGMSYWKINMHDLLAQLGREIVRKQPIQERWFFYDDREISDLRTHTTCSTSVMGISLNLSEMDDQSFISENVFEEMCNLQFLKVYGDRIDRIDCDRLYLPQKLKLLEWDYFPMTCLPINFQTDFLVTLDMRSSKLEKLWEGIRPLRNLKTMIFQGSKRLKDLSDLSTATNLHKLDLGDCSTLVKLPSSIGNATNLHELYLNGCSSLVELPSSIGNVTKLHTLYLNGCSSLVKLPSSIGNATNLHTLYLNGCSNLVELPSSIGNATNLHELYLKDCSRLVELTSSIGNATNLHELYLNGCSRLVELPSSIGNATKLRELNLSGCSSLVELPSSIGNATKLRKLNLSGCSSLVELPSSIGNVTDLGNLNFKGCSSLVELPSSIGNFTYLHQLNLSGCSSLVELTSSIGNATNLRGLDFSGFSSVVELPFFIGNFTDLRTLNLSGCASLVKLSSSIGNATKLVKLNLQRCSSLVELPSSIGNATNLEKLDLSGCSSLVELPSSIENLHKLSSMDLEGCSKVESLPTNINLESLEFLNLTNCSRLKKFPEISVELACLSLIGTAIEEVPSSIKSWPRLYTLCMPYNAKLKEFPHALESITMLGFNDAEIKEVISLVKGFSRLNGIVLDGCRKLVSLPQLPDSISILSAENCESLERLDCSFHHQNMYLDFGNCFKLNNEARDLIFKASPPKSCTNCLPGREVPAYFTNRAVGGSVRVKLNESVLSTPLRFKACILLVNKVEHEAGKSKKLSLSCRIMGKHNEVKCTSARSHHLYVFELQATNSSELLFEFKISSGKGGIGEWEIGECGVRLLTPDEIIMETKQDEISDDEYDWMEMHFEE